MEKVGIKTTISTQILWKVGLSGQLRRFTAQCIQFKVMEKTLITVNVHEECYLFVFFYTD